MELVQPIRDRKKLNAMKIYLKGKSLRDYLLLMIGISSSLRISDIRLLQVKDIWNGKQVMPFIKVKEKKTGKTKKFPVGKNLESAIKEYISTYQPANPNDFIFFSRKGKKPITRTQALRIIKEAGVAVGITDNLGTHSLRKTWGYWAYQSGFDLALLSEAFNHTSERVTRRYIGITQEDIDDIYIKLNL